MESDGGYESGGKDKVCWNVEDTINVMSLVKLVFYTFTGNVTFLIFQIFFPWRKWRS